MMKVSHKRRCMSGMFLKKQDRQCAYNVTWRCVRAKIVVVEKLYVFYICEYIFVVFRTRHKKIIRHVVIFGLLGRTIFIHITS